MLGTKVNMVQICLLLTLLIISQTYSICEWKTIESTGMYIIECNKTNETTVIMQHEQSAESVQALKMYGYDTSTITQKILTKFSSLTQFVVTDSLRVEEIDKDSFSSLPFLETVKITNTSLKNVPELLLENTSVKIFSLQNNVHLRIPADSSLLDSLSLKVLNIANCHVDRLFEITFSLLPNLEELYLQENKLSTLPDDLFIANKRLKILSISNNELIHLEPTVFKYMDLTYLDLHRNKWNCSCSLMPLIKWSERSQSGVFNWTEIDCQREDKDLPIATWSTTKEQCLEVSSSQHLFDQLKLLLNNTNDNGSPKDHISEVSLLTTVTTPAVSITDYELPESSGSEKKHRQTDTSSTPRLDEDSTLGIDTYNNAAMTGTEKPSASANTGIDSNSKASESAPGGGGSASVHASLTLTFITMLLMLLRKV